MQPCPALAQGLAGCTLKARKADLGTGADVGGAEEPALKAALHVADPAQELQPATSLLIEDLLQHLRLQRACKRMCGVITVFLAKDDDNGGENP